MFWYRAEITKGEPIRYISHLDYASVLERAVRRAKLPAAYSEGFNPHMKLAFASALAVGVTSEAEYMDLELTQDLCQPEVFDRLRAVLPTGVELLQLKKLAGKPKALMAVADEAGYEIVAPLQGNWSAAQAAQADWAAAGSVVYERVTPKKTRQIEVKDYVKDFQLGLRNKAVILTMSVKITATGSITAGEVLSVLRQEFGLPVDDKQALICRKYLFSEGKPLLDLV